MSAIKTRNRATPTSEEGKFGQRVLRGPAILLSGFAVLMAAIAGVTILAVAGDNSSGGNEPAAALPESAASPAAQAGATSGAAATDISAAAGKGIDFEPYKRPAPTLPAVPPGPVKEFRVDVFEHVTKVSDDLAPTRVWSYGVNGTLPRGTGVSPRSSSGKATGSG